MIEYWHWFFIAGVLLIIEMLTFTTFFLFFAMAFALMGIISITNPGMSLNLELTLAGALSILSMLASYAIFKSRRKAPFDTNNRMAQQIGKEITLLKDSENGVSKAKIGDTEWRVLIDDGKKGEVVQITGFKSTSFVCRKQGQNTV